MGSRMVWMAIALSIEQLIIPCAGPAQGQENYSITNFTTLNGLPHNHVDDVAEDLTGFLWIATWDGLSRFDGYEFRNYYHNPDDSTTLPASIVHKLLVDRYNNLWIRVLDGRIVRYNRAKDCFTRERQHQNFIPQDIALDGNGECWKINMNEGPAKFDYGLQRFIPYSVTGPDGDRITFNETNLVFLFFDSKGFPWIFAANDKVTRVYASEVQPGNRLKVKAIYNQGVKLPGASSSGGGLDIYHFPATRVSESGQSQVPPAIILIDKRLSVLNKINTSPDLTGYSHLPIFEWSVNGNSVRPYTGRYDHFNRVNLPGHQYIRTFYTDSRGNTWYYCQKGSGEGDGLTLCSPVPGFFKNYLFEYDKTGLTNAYFAVHKDRRGDIWASPRNLDHIFRIKPGGEVTASNPLADKKWVNIQHARSFVEDTAGLWIGYFRDRLFYFDFKTEKFISKVSLSPHKDSTTRYQSFKNMVKEGKRLYYLFNNQINSYDISSGKISGVTKIENGNGYCLVRNGDEGYWAGYSYKGVVRYDKQFRVTGTWTISDGWFNIEDICPGDHNDLWIASMGGGLVHLFPESGKSETFTTANGLSNNTCYAILKDREGCLWISTNHGISRFNPATRQFRVFGPGDGLIIDEFNSDAACLSADGEMIFGGMGGIVGFYPDSLTENGGRLTDIRLIVNNLRVSGNDRLFQKAIYELDTLTLQTGENNFKVNFAAIDFVHADKIKYRYQLSGVDETFVETDFRHRYVNYANLDPGKYKLVIDASNPDGEWVARKTLLLVLPPHYYQAWWFRILAAFVGLSLLAILILMYVRQVRLKAERKQAELKLESLRGQMNPHFIFNSLNSINYFISKNDRLSANRYIADFSRLIRSFLGNLSKEFVPLERELETVRNYLQLEHLRFGDKFDYSLEIEETLETGEREIFPGMVQPFIENAIWHGIRGSVSPKGRISVNFYMGAEDFCICRVIDDGIGRKLSEERKSESQGKKSQGIAIVRERLRIINSLRNKNYRLVIEDLYPGGEETGTAVTIEIPLKTNT